MGVASSSPCPSRPQTAVSTLEEPAQQNLLFEQLGTLQNVWARYFGDVQRSWFVIAGIGIGAALVMSFVMLIVIKTCTWLMVWLVIFLMMVIMIAITFFCYFKGASRSFAVEPPPPSPCAPLQPASSTLTLSRT